MNFWWKVTALAAFLAIYGTSVWHIHTWYDGSKETKALEHEAAVTKDEMKKSNVIDTGFSESSAHLDQLQRSAQLKMEAINASPVPACNCSISPQRLSVFNDALSANPPAQ